MLGRHYLSSPPGRGWTISAIAPLGGDLQIIVAIPPEQASVLRRQPAEEQFRHVAEQVCPAKGAAVWRTIPAGSRVILLPSVAGEVFIEVDCGH